MAKKCGRCGKRRHRSLATAISAALRNSARHGLAFRPYWDPACRTWHLTTQPLREVRRA